MNPKDLKSFLDFKSQQYESIEFITHDPIQIPHQFSNKKDIEISDYVLQNFEDEEINKLELLTNNIINSISILIEKKLDLFSSTVNNK